jgi:hypothetical protein
MKQAITVFFAALILAVGAYFLAASDFHAIPDAQASLSVSQPSPAPADTQAGAVDATQLQSSLPAAAACGGRTCDYQACGCSPRDCANGCGSRCGSR